MSMARSRREAKIKSSGCTAAAAMCGGEGNSLKYFIAGSGSSPAKIIFPICETLRVPQIFVSFPSPDKAGKIYIRDRDAEFKILNIIAKILDSTKGKHLQGIWVTLRVEQPPCCSCKKAINDFRLRFPNVMLDVRVGIDGVRKTIKKINKSKNNGENIDVIESALEVGKLFMPYL